MISLVCPVLGLDLGRKRTGVAISENGVLAKPLTLLRHTNDPRELAHRVTEQVKLTGAKTLVFGLPLHQDGQASPQSEWVEGVIQIIKSLLAGQVIIDRQDEHASTLDSRLIYPDLDDNLAAAIIILQDWLDIQPAS